jgi:4-hydroxy-3-methylbut-2-enyl diphosphate reductase
MMVVGGYNSSNTCHLAALATSHKVTTYHIEDALGIDVDGGGLRHQMVGQKVETSIAPGWMLASGVVGLTAGASTPNNKVGETVVRLCQVAGLGEELEKALGTR